MSGKRVLTMDRQGDFRIRATGKNHCGVVENLDIKYKMICVCDASLDRRGFLFDQINVDNFFKGIKESKLSCEKLTMQCVRELLRMIRVENPICRIQTMSLTLSPAPFLASMTYDWEAPARLGRVTKQRTKPFISF